MQSGAATVDEYLAELPEDRRQAISTVRDEILKNLPQGYEEQMIYGMIGYVVPFALWPAGYHCDPKLPLTYAALASQKQHMAVYLMNIYMTNDSESWFINEYKKTGKRMDIGKSCVRFKKLEHLPVELIGQAIARTSVQDYLDIYQQNLAEAEANRLARKAAKAKA